MKTYHPNLDGYAEPVGMAMPDETIIERRIISEDGTVTIKGPIGIQHRQSSSGDTLADLDEMNSDCNSRIERQVKLCRTLQRKLLESKNELELMAVQSSFINVRIRRWKEEVMKS